MSNKKSSSSLKSKNKQKFLKKDYRKKDTIYGGTPIQKYQNSIRLLERYIQDRNIDFTFVERDDEFLRNYGLKRTDIFGVMIPKKDIYESIIISYAFEGMVKEGEIQVNIPKKSKKILDESMQRWLSVFVHHLIRAWHSTGFQEQVGMGKLWDDIDYLSNLWYDINLDKIKAGTFDDEATIEIADLVALFNRDILIDKDTYTNSLTWKDLTRRDKKFLFDRYKHIAHADGLELPIILGLDITGDLQTEKINFEKYLKSLSSLL